MTSLTISADRRLGDKVYEDLLQLLGTPGFEPRARLPGETALSQRLGVSRPVLRQALARLRDEGRVYARKGSGTFVTDALPQARPPSLSTLNNIADIRAFLEFRLRGRRGRCPCGTDAHRGRDASPSPVP